MSRHPYTYAADFIRSLAGYDSQGTKLSRSDASQICSGISEALGMDNHELACKLSEYAQANDERLSEEAIRKFALATGISVS